MTVNSDANEAFCRGENAFRLRAVEAAIREFTSAEALGYDPARCAGYRWQCWMLLGKFQEAWRESNAIRLLGGFDPNALWDGKPFSGKRVVIRCLHGFGDAIQFLRYAERVRQSASRVIVETHPEMLSLVACVRGVDEVTTWANGMPLPRECWDQQVEVTELPRAFAADLSPLSYDVPYICVSDNAKQRSAGFLKGTGRPKVGLVWASSMWNPARCIPLLDLLPILLLNGFDFYSFQRGEPSQELTSLPPSVYIHDTSAHSAEIVDTAADLTNMDLLITVDTMAAHLAGALGKNVWTLLPYEADWRWMMDRSDTPWYPTMRLFRQARAADWSPVVGQLVEALTCLTF